MTAPLPRRAPFRWPLVPFIGIMLVVAALPWIVGGNGQGDVPRKTVAGPAVASSLPSLAELSETVRRPLFDSLRQPAKTAEVQASGSGPVVIGRYRLIGIISSGSRRQAMLARIDTGRSTLYAVDDALDDWKVESVSEDGLTVRRNAETETVRLKSGTAPRR